jgi:hypothetical protein
MMMESSELLFHDGGARKRRRMDNDHGKGDDAAASAEEEDNKGESYVHCFLAVTPVPYAKEGYVCVAVGTLVRAKNSNMDPKNLYVFPEEIKLPRDLAEWEEALPHIVV